MFVSFDEKAWDLDCSSQEVSHLNSFITSRPPDKPRDVSRSTIPLSLGRKMHLTNSDHAPRFGGIPELQSEKNVQSHDFSKLEDDTVATNGSTTANAHTIKPNEVSIPYPQDRGIPEVLDAVLVALSLIHI